MQITLKNTLSDEKEEFKPIAEGKVSMYHCGPTVYNNAHIGNLRSYVFADILRRAMEWNGYEVKQVINITDVGHLTSDADFGDDKMVKALKRLNKPMTMDAMREVADIYFTKFKDDLVALNIKLPTHFPFASDHIAEDIEIIKKIDENGFAYKIENNTSSDGIYFNVQEFEKKEHLYGRLTGGMKVDPAFSRVTPAEGKKDHRDFTLWKFSREEGLGFDSPFGRGFPGWHIECSAMSRKYLDQPFDIHTGGIDHIPVHHNNEIAQSEAAYNSPLAHVWMHNAFLNIKSADGEDAKMAKSGENFITLQTLREKNINPLALRYLYLTAHYSTPVNFSWEALDGAEAAWKKLKGVVSIPFGSKKSERTKMYSKEFTKYINDDLDTPKALALIWEIAKDANVTLEEKKYMILEFDKVLGLKLDEREEIEIPDDIKKLKEQRDAARQRKDWMEADRLRKEIENKGFSVRDTDTGQVLDRI